MSRATTQERFKNESYFKELQKEFVGKKTPGPGKYNYDDQFKRKKKLGMICPINRSVWESRTEFPNLKPRQRLDHHIAYMKLV